MAAMNNQQSTNFYIGRCNFASSLVRADKSIVLAVSTAIVALLTEPALAAVAGVLGCLCWDAGVNITPVYSGVAPVAKFFANIGQVLSAPIMSLDVLHFVEDCPAFLQASVQLRDRNEAVCFRLHTRRARYVSLARADESIVILVSTTIGALLTEPALAAGAGVHRHLA